MATINDKKFIDNVIANNGFYNGDDEDTPDNPRCIKIVEYTNAWGKTAWGLIFKGDSLIKYNASDFIFNPKTIWEYKSNERSRS